MEDLNVEFFFHREERFYFVKIDLQLKLRFKVNSILVLFFKRVLKEYYN